MLSVSLVSLGAAAQQQMPAGSMAPQSAAAREAPALTPQQQGQISYVSGGASADDRATMQSMAGNYNVHLMFAEQTSGDYLAGVGVRLDDSRGNTVLDTVSDGPLFYAHVPAGHYRVTVAIDGKSQTRPLDVGAGGIRAQSFYWAHVG
jgi:hypothetical protein